MIPAPREPSAQSFGGDCLERMGLIEDDEVAREQELVFRAQVGEQREEQRVVHDQQLGLACALLCPLEEAPPAARLRCAHAGF